MHRLDIGGAPTCIGEIESFFDHVRDEAIGGDEQAEARADDVEIRQLQGRHAGHRKKEKKEKREQTQAKWKVKWQPYQPGKRSR